MATEGKSEARRKDCHSVSQRRELRQPHPWRCRGPQPSPPAGTCIGRRTGPRRIQHRVRLQRPRALRRHPQLNPG